MGGREFAGYRPEQILERTTLDNDDVCQTCGKPLKKGSKVDTRDRKRFFCDEICERTDYLKQEGRAAPGQHRVG